MWTRKKPVPLDIIIVGQLWHSQPFSCSCVLNIQYFKHNKNIDNTNLTKQQDNKLMSTLDK